MTGSLYASVAGLRAHMQKLTVIGNNVANVNTQGYKKQRTIFRDSVYSMYSSGSNGTQTIGGMNPSQLGYGSMIGSIDLNMSSSSYNPGNPTDCALVGDGFFLVGDKDVQYSLDPNNNDSIKALNLTRVGDFKIGPDNFLVDGKGSVVYGFLTVGIDPVSKEPIISDQLVPIRLPHWERVAVQQTTEGEGNGNAGADAETPVTEMTYKYEIRYPIVEEGEGDNKTGIPLKENIEPTVNPETGLPLAEGATPNAEWPKLDYAKFSSISIDKGTGAINGIAQEGDQPVCIGYLAIGNVTNPNGVTHIGNSYYKCQEGAGDMWVSMLGNVQKDLGLEYYNSYMIETTGTGDTAVRNNPPLAAITGTATEMMTGFLEAPNTDLAEEITELITTQRGYQANTRIITVTDSMLEELVNMKR